MSDQTQPPEPQETTALQPASAGQQPTDEFDSDGIQRVLFYSILGGLCPLIPIPFIDDLLIRYIRRHMLEAQLKNAGLAPMIRHVDALAYEETGSCLTGCLSFAILYPLKKLFRKILYFLAIKDCVDVTSNLLHEGWLINYALQQGLLSEAVLASDDDLKQLQPLRAAIIATCTAIDTRPINQLISRIFTNSKSAVKQTARSLGTNLKKAGAVRRKPESVEHALESIEGEGEEKKLGGLTEQLRTSLSGHQTYLRELEALFLDNFKRLRDEAKQN